MIRQIRVKIETEHIEDRLIIKNAPANLSERELLQLILENYKKWHFPKVHELEFLSESVDLTGEIAVRESYGSIYKKKLDPIIFQISGHFANEIKKRFSNFYDICWSFNKQKKFNVDMDCPFQIEKNGEGIGYALINFPFDFGAVFAELEIIDASDDGDLCIGLLGQHDISNGKFFENSHSSTIYWNSGLVRTCKNNEDYKQFGKGYTIGVLLRNDGYIEFFNGQDGLIFSTDTCKNNENKNIGIMSDQEKCTIKISYPTYEEFSKKYKSEFIINNKNKFEEVTNYLQNMRKMQTKQFLNELQLFSETNDILVWDQPVAYKNERNNKITFPELTVVQAPKMDYGNNHYYVKTLGCLNDGIHFFEVEIENMNIENRSHVGVMADSFDHQLGTGNFWGYNNYGDLYKHNRRVQSAYGEKFANDGDKIGVFLDLDAGQIEFYVNDVSQGIAFSDVIGPVSFFVNMKNNNTKYRILPSNLETYFYYKYADQIIDDVFFKEQCSGVEFDGDSKCRIIGESAIINCKKRFRNGRRYFEVDCENLKGIVQFGFNNHKWEIQLEKKPDLDIDLDNLEIDIPDELSENVKDGEIDFSNFMKLGVLVDFDDYKIIIYKDRKVLVEKNLENIKKPLSGYMMILPEHKDGSTIISINTSAEDDMRDILFLYE